MSSPVVSPCSQASSSLQLTPRRRVQALLAGLSDSEDDVLPFKKHTGPARPTVRSQFPPESTEPVSRAVSSSPASSNVTDHNDAIPRVRRRLLGQSRESDAQNVQSSEDDARPTADNDSPLSAKSASSSSSKRKFSDLTVDATTKRDDRSRFQALVDKQRKLRLEREEAEKAKDEARRARITDDVRATKATRTSSPAASSEEDSDASMRQAARKLTKDAWPTRKASRRALEEMSRETQRMNRNMQLAHQAKTKKKFTKEDLLARFSVVSLPPLPSNQGLSNPTALVISDNEGIHIGSTPPSSPPKTPEADKSIRHMHTDPVVQLAFDDNEFDELPTLEQMIAARRLEAAPAEKVIPITKQATARRFVIAKHASDSDSDLDIVQDRASKKKYAAFENVSKKKTHEQASHLALRSLANLQANKDKSKISSVEMAAQLHQAARDQAREERQAKIEKLKAKGIVIQTAEEKEKDQLEIEDLVEKARAEATEIHKRETARAKKDGTLEKDALDMLDDSDEDDGEYEEDVDDAQSGSEDERGSAEHNDEEQEVDSADDAAEEHESVADIDTLVSVDDIDVSHQETPNAVQMPMSRITRAKRVIEDDDEDESVGTPQKLVSAASTLPWKTPQTVRQSTRKIIPGLQHSDDLPMGLTQAFDATMAESQTQSQRDVQEDSMDILRSLPTPGLGDTPALTRHESLDLVAESPVASQTQPLGLNLGASQFQFDIASPTIARQTATTQPIFEPTQDDGYKYSPFSGDRFAETPLKEIHSTEDTVILEAAQSPLKQRGRLRRGHVDTGDEEAVESADVFSLMRQAAKVSEAADFNKKKSEARAAVDEAAEESDDEYAGLGGASDEDSDEEANAEDRAMLDDDTLIDKSDESKLAALYADRERANDEAAVSKLLKDITTGALRRKRGAGDDLDLSDEEDDTARRRDAKRREFAKMRRELLKDEAVGKIAEDKKKEAFLRSIEDREVIDDEEFIEFDKPETQQEESQSQPAVQPQSQQPGNDTALQPISEPRLNKVSNTFRRVQQDISTAKPTTLAQIRETVSFLIEEPESQAAMIDLGLSDSEEEPETYVDLGRHFQQANADEDTAMDEEGEDLLDFIDDSQSADLKKPTAPLAPPPRPNYTARRTPAQVIDRLALSRESSSALSTTSSKPAFARTFTPTLSTVPSLLRRATTNSSITHNISATGVRTAKAERASSIDSRKEFVRKAAGTNRNAVNFRGGARKSLKEEKLAEREEMVKKRKGMSGNVSVGLGGLFRGDTWE